MEDVVKKGTGTRLQLSNMPVAGKTGTTDNYKDLWFSGYTPYCTCSVWAGYDNNIVLPKGQARTYQQTLWQKIMQRIHNDLPKTEFKVPSTVEKKSICKDSGLLASSSCDAVTEYYDTETLPKKYCSGHKKAKPDDNDKPNANKPGGTSEEPPQTQPETPETPQGQPETPQEQPESPTPPAPPAGQ